MRCARSASRSDDGSAAAGFALVAPLAAAVFVVAVQATLLLAQRAAVHSAAHTGARVAATLGSTSASGEASARQVLVAHGLGTAPAAFTWRSVTVSGVRFVSVTVQLPVRVTWLDETVVLEGTAASVDESAL